MSKQLLFIRGCRYIFSGVALKFLQMGRNWWQGHGQPRTSVSVLVRGFSEEREIPVPLSGQYISAGAGSEVVKKGEDILSIYGSIIGAPFDGVIRDLLREDLWSAIGTMLTDFDPRKYQPFIREVSTKALSVCGSVLEAILSCKYVRLSFD